VLFQPHYSQAQLYHQSLKSKITMNSEELQCLDKNVNLKIEESYFTYLFAEIIDRSDIFHLQANYC